jgi:hypothetical protein
MMDVLEQDWNGAKHLGKAVTQEQAKMMIPLVQKTKDIEYQAVQIIKEAIPS